MNWRFGQMSAAAALSDQLSQIALQLQVSHLVQHFGGGVGAGAGPLAARSFLGGLLPESLLYVLTSSGPQAFAAAMVGDSDTPELVWTHRMRAQRLVPQVSCRAGCPAVLVHQGMPYVIFGVRKYVAAMGGD